MTVSGKRDAVKRVKKGFLKHYLYLICVIYKVRICCTQNPKLYLFLSFNFFACLDQ